nr:MAG TPA: hypothetical protein [Caudoviricetes sp.]
MKDRTPKFPGRVKLDPVAGQTNIYDMTRADEPDDTGTPFNTRTMLQDSTARFLRIPVSNPFVDDALRHMPDRINPIGTIRTSPALSLGDAWLPCDGSQVTFAEYPQLCQILRNTVGDVSWQHLTVGTTPDFKGMSRAVFFKGKWYIAGNCSIVESSTYTYKLTIAVSDTITGPYKAIYTKTRTGSTNQANSEKPEDVQLAASGDMLCAIYGHNASYGVSATEDGTTWAEREVNYQLPTGKDNGEISIKGFATDGTYWAFTSGRQIIYTMDPMSDEQWSVNEVASYPYEFTGRLSFVNGTWMICSWRSGNRLNNPDNIRINYTKVPGGNWTTVSIGEVNTLTKYASSITWWSGRYWVAYYYKSSNQGESMAYLASAYESDLKTWSILELGDVDLGYVDNSDVVYSMPYDFTATSNLLVLVCNEDEIKTTSDPIIGWNNVTLPVGAVPTDLATAGDAIVAACSDMIVYHDYSTETRLLPTISLSGDTTTFIKVKKELDVFEAQQSGG